MKKREFRIRAVHGIKKVSGYPATFPGFEQFHFFTFHEPSGWNVSEETTGHCLVNGKPTRRAGITETAKKLQKVGVAALVDCLAQTTKLDDIEAAIRLEASASEILEEVS